VLGGAVSVARSDVGHADLTRLPVGDTHIVRTPTVGGLDLCTTFPTNGPGATAQGPWFNGDGTYDLTKKTFVQGDVSWPDATFRQSVQGTNRVLVGNDLPIGHNTGTFPIAANDPAYRYDPGNRASIVANPYSIAIAATPKPAASPGCVAGEVGILLDGVILNSPVDARGRDAVAWEEQDRCFGHPNPVGYHFHSVSPCVSDPVTGPSGVVGFALDGYPITGHRGEGGKVLTNADLDECHGTTSTIQLDGRPVMTYHYVATWEFPYAVGCFHGTYTATGPVLKPAR